MRNSAWRKESGARLRENGFPSDRELIVAFENLERLVFAVMNVQGRAAARHVVRLDHAERTAGVATVEAYVQGNAQDVQWLTTVGGDKD